MTTDFSEKLQDKLDRIIENIHKVELFQRESIAALEDKVNRKFTLFESKLDARLLKLETDLVELKSKISVHSAVVAIVTAVIVSALVSYVKLKGTF